MKVQTYLRLANIDCVDRVGVDNIGKSPRKQLSFIDDHGTIFADSGMIIKHLKSQYGDNLDKDLSDEQRALGHAVARMLEDGSYWIGLRDRWCGSDQVWEAYEPVLFGALPKPLRLFVPKLVRRDYRKRLRGLGLGRRPDTEIKALGETNVQSVATLISGKAFLLGDRVASYEATSRSWATPTGSLPSLTLAPPSPAHPTFSHRWQVLLSPETAAGTGSGQPRPRSQAASLL